MISSSVGLSYAEPERATGQTNVMVPTAKMQKSARPPTIQQYATLLEVSKSIVSHKSLADLFHDLSERLNDLLTFHYLSLVLYDPARNVMRMHVLETTAPTSIHEGDEYSMEESPSALTLETQKPVIVNDTETCGQFPRVMKLLREQNVRSFCSLPLTSAHRRLGTMNFGAAEPGAFSENELEFPQLVAAQLAVAVDNALIFEEAQTLHHQLARDRDRLQLLLDLNNRVVSNLDLRELFGAISSGIRRVMACDYAGLSLPDPEKDRMMRMYALDFPEGKGLLHEEMLVPFDHASSAKAYLTMRPLVLSKSSPEWQNSPIASVREKEGLTNLCFLPLISRGRAIGSLNLGRLRDEAFTQEDVHFLSQTAGQIAIAVENALDYGHVNESRARLAEERRYLKEEIQTEHNFEEIVGESPSLKAVLRQVETVAPTNSTVLILGETGTGKELIARAIHNLSPRREQAFVKVNCAAIPLGLLESELFGHERGAFTGAIAQKVGRFELANKGTIFLDEVGDIPLELQPKLLRVLQEQEFERLGGTRTTRVDVRLVAATSGDLSQMIADNQFRRDLFYRLNIFPVSVPPLRERRSDIPKLVEHFVAKYAKAMNKKVPSVPSSTLDVLREYNWPGNIRELQNVIERAVILTPGSVLRAPLSGLKGTSNELTAAKPATLQEVERQHILEVLRENKWVIGGPNGAAAKLGMKRTSLVYKMNKLGIEKPWK
jgi:formate hydrogenlyase transcriptional activator